MYIIVSDTKRKVGFKGLEVSDIVIGLPLFIILLLLFQYTCFLETVDKNRNTSVNLLACVGCH